MKDIKIYFIAIVKYSWNIKIYKIKKNRLIVIVIICLRLNFDFSPIYKEYIREINKNSVFILYNICEKNKKNSNLLSDYIVYNKVGIKKKKKEKKNGKICCNYCSIASLFRVIYIEVDAKAKAKAKAKPLCRAQNLLLRPPPCTSLDAWNPSCESRKWFLASCTSDDASLALYSLVWWCWILAVVSWG